MHSLLDDPLFCIRTPDDTTDDRTLPEILHALSDAGNGVDSFEALQPHQQQPWYMLLVQLAAMAVARETGGTVPTTPDGWRTALLALADGTEAAWHLVTPDLAAPAFLQPPVPEGDLGGFKSDLPTPDQLDVLVTSKSHDVKATRITQPRPEHWVYALVTLQTMEGFLGRGNYGVVRMNGGFGNRPLVGIAPALSPASRFQRDLQVLLDVRPTFSDRYDLSGPALLWTLPWDGKKASALPIWDLDPYFVEVCRRIRFTAGDDDPLTCWRATSKGQRVDAPGSLNGVTGDPWTPIDKSAAKALTLGGGGFTYQKIHQILLSGEYEKPPALKVQASEDGMMYLVAQTLVRGQGKTEGLHHRVVPIPANVRSLFGRKSDLEQLALRAEARIEKAADVQRTVLYPAIGTLLGGGDTDGVDGDDLRPWLDAFDQAVDDAFFPELWKSVDLDADAAEASWHRVLREAAETQFHDAEGHAPRTATRYWKARSTAQTIFWGSLRRNLPAAFEDDEVTSPA